MKKKYLTLPRAHFVRARLWPPEVKILLLEGIPSFLWKKSFLSEASPSPSPNGPLPLLLQELFDFGTGSGLFTVIDIMNLAHPTDG